MRPYFIQVCSKGTAPDPCKETTVISRLLEALSELLEKEEKGKSFEVMRVYCTVLATRAGTGGGGQMSWAECGRGLHAEESVHRILRLSRHSMIQTIIATACSKTDLGRCAHTRCLLPPYSGSHVPSQMGEQFPLPGLSPSQSGPPLQVGGTRRQQLHHCFPTLQTPPLTPA